MTHSVDTKNERLKFDTTDTWLHNCKLSSSKLLKCDSQGKDYSIKKAKEWRGNIGKR
jgi:hypothetical protein